MELDGAQGASFSALPAHPVWDGVGGRGAGLKRKGEGKRPDSSQDGGTEMVWSTSWLLLTTPLSRSSHFFPPWFRLTGEREG